MSTTKLILTNLYGRLYRLYRGLMVILKFLRVAETYKIDQIISVYNFNRVNLSVFSWFVSRGGLCIIFALRPTSV